MSDKLCSGSVLSSCSDAHCLAPNRTGLSIRAHPFLLTIFLLWFGTGQPSRFWTSRADLLAAELTPAGLLPEAATNGPIVWRFEESSAGVVRSETGLYPGYLLSGARLVNGGVSGRALSLDRTLSSYVDLGYVLGMEDASFSWVVWVKTEPGDITENNLVLAKHKAGDNNGYFLNINVSGILGQAGKAMFFAGDPLVVPVSQTSVNDGRWHQLVAVHEAKGNNSLFIDGTLEAHAASQAVLPSPAPLLFGGALFNGQAQGKYTGLIDEVQFYDRALTAVEVARLYVAAPPTVDRELWVFTVAGSGRAAWEDGVGAAASFNAPNGGAVGPDGAAYIADTFNHAIRRVELASGRVTTVAGTGKAGSRAGSADLAQFNAPLAVYFDRGGGALFVADTGNNRICKVSADKPRQVTPWAGNGQAGFQDGPTGTAQFDFPNDLLMDAVGNMYVTEFNNHTVRKITTKGDVFTFVGNGRAGFADGVGSQAQLNQPAGLAMDRAGNLYLTEWGSHRIRKVTPSGVVTTLAGSLFPGLVDGVGVQARFYQPDGIVADPFGTLFVSEHGNHAVRRIAPDGTVTTLAGGRSGMLDGAAAMAQFNAPGGLGIDDANNLVVVDTGNQRVRQISVLSAPQVLVEVPVRKFPVGEMVTLHAQASGSAPLSYQWKYNGREIEQATDPDLKLLNLQPDQSGDYSVVVRNPRAAVDSSPVTLTVIVPVSYGRVLPGYYSPGRNLTVRLEARFSPGASDSWACAVEDRPPAEWTIVRVGSGGVLDLATGNVKFGPFFADAPATLWYEIRPPAGDHGLNTFTGVVSINGTEFPISGPAAVAPAPFHPADVAPSDYRLSIDELTAYASSWRKGQPWKIQPNPIPVAYVTRAGLLWKTGEAYTLDPNVSDPPLWWVSAGGSAPATEAALRLDTTILGGTAERVLPSRLTYQPFEVQVLVRPPSGGVAYAIEECVPAAFQVCAVNEQGAFDQERQVIRWGPFLDGLPRQLSYQLIATLSPHALATFCGAISWDGRMQPVLGDTILAVSTRGAASISATPGELYLQFGPPDGLSYRVEVSSDLRMWTPWQVLTNTAGVLPLDDPEARHLSRRFYRIGGLAP